MGRRYGERRSQNYGDVGEIKVLYDGKDNKGYLHDNDRAVPNDYIKHPGMTRLEVVPGRAEGHANQG